MANQLLTISMITRESLMSLINNLCAARRVTRQYDKEFGVKGAKIGTTLNVRKPPRYIGRVGQALQLEDAIETSVPVVLTTQRGVDIAFTSADLALSIDDFSKRFIKPAILSVANWIDYDVLQLALSSVYNEVGTPGTVPNALLTYLQAGQRLDEEACPRDNDRTLIVSPAMQATIVDQLKGLFQASAEIARQYERGIMGESIGFEWDMDQNCPVHTVGAYAGAGAVNGAGQTGNNIVTNGWTANAAILNAGDVVTFAGVYAVNPQNRQSTGSLRQFLVTQNVVADGAGNATIPISGPGGLGVVVNGPFQTVTASPANAAAVTVNGAAGTGPTYRGLAFHESAFTLASADLPLPGGVDMAAREGDDEVGLSIRLVRAYDINLDRFPCRLDVLYGTAALYPELACRIAS